MSSCVTGMNECRMQNSTGVRRLTGGRQPTRMIQKRKETFWGRKQKIITGNNVHGAGTRTQRL